MLNFLNAKNIFTVLLMILCGQLCTSCTDDNAEIPSWAGQEGSVTINISLPEPVVLSPTARGATDFDRIDNIQVVVAEGDEDNSKIIGCYSNFPNANNGTGVSFDGNNTVHFSKDLSYGSKTIYVIANYESPLTLTKMTTVGELKKTTQTPAVLPGIPIASTSIMVAKATVISGDHGHTSDKGVTMEAKLQRRVAMVTVKINGESLKDNVIITPRKISLFRVPESCSIGEKREWTEYEIIERGETKEVEWGTIVGSTSIHGSQHETGGHYGDDYNLSSVIPLFMFENYHGGDEFGHSDEDEQTKRPQECNVTDAEGIHSHVSTQTCSYLEVETYYVYMNDEGTNSEYSGTAKFRLFLGDDVTRNFDVLGNHYYKVTLNLQGVAVREGGQVNEDGDLITNGTETWRVETDLGEISVADNEININGSGEFLPIKVEGQELDKIALRLTETSEEFIYLSEGATINGKWLLLDSNNGHNPNAGKANGTMWLYAPPMLDESQYDSKTKRVAEIEVYSDRSMKPEDLVTTIRIVQYLPIKAEMSATEFPYIKKVFGEDVEIMTIYIDRIDRTALPWGFDEHILNENQNDGFENTFHLINESGDQTCGATHLAVARKYLPFGTGVKDWNGEAISNERSAMIYALMLHENQTPDGPPDESLAVTINRTEFPKKDLGGNGNIVRYWSIPSIAGWQMVEKLSKAGKLDLEHPILPYLRYWTSNAVSTTSGESVVVDGTENDGSQFAYTYQFGWGLDALKESDTYPMEQIAWRKDPLRFRLISVHPSNFPVD